MVSGPNTTAAIQMGIFEGHSSLDCNLATAVYTTSAAAAEAAWLTAAT
jgi:hypothetical protein